MLSFAPMIMRHYHAGCVRMVQNGIFFGVLGVRLYVEHRKNGKLTQKRVPLDGIPVFQ